MKYNCYFGTSKIRLIYLINFKKIYSQNSKISPIGDYLILKFIKKSEKKFSNILII